jgi:hypothetical protein
MVGVAFLFLDSEPPLYRRDPEEFLGIGKPVGEVLERNISMKHLGHLRLKGLLGVVGFMRRRFKKN